MPSKAKTETLLGWKIAIFGIRFIFICCLYLQFYCLIERQLSMFATDKHITHNIVAMLYSASRCFHLFERFFSLVDSIVLQFSCFVFIITTRQSIVFCVFAFIYAICLIVHGPSIILFGAYCAAYKKKWWVDSNVMRKKHEKLVTFSAFGLRFRLKSIQNKWL